ncbi:RHS repeat domain-containing protein [Bacillus sp. DJP31]|uniref:RHS repeat domain-containing protein n=1 Tax=Bacillus sp. DJP31 TaxID=3409789 RepID=UPI003BB7E78C
MTGEAGKNKSIKQRINISGDQNTKLTLSGWSKQVGADLNGGYYNLQVAINYTDGTVDWDYANDFSKTESDWQHVAAEVKPKKAFNSIDVYYYYWNQTGTAWFDAMRLELGASHTFNTYDSGGNYVTSIKDPVGNTATFGYDAVGNQTSVKDGKGQATSYTYDSRNLLTKVTDAKLGITTYSYDGNGNRTTVTDVKQNVTKYDYNEFNLVSKITNPLNKVIQFEYDRNGNETKIVFPEGDSISSTYDALNRLISTSVNGTKKWEYGYDANENLTSVIDASGKQTTFTNDKNNRLIQEDKGSAKNEFGYDPNDNLNSVKFTAGTTTVSTELAYNEINQLIALARNGNNQAKFVYDERGNMTSVNRANNTYTAQNYDDVNRLGELKNYKKDGTLLDSYKYSYDANGNQTSIVTSDGTVSYEYDALNQLTKETLTDGTIINYEYDMVGNRTKKTVTKGATTTTTTYTYNAGNELTSVNGQAYTHDQNGNLINDGEKTYVYNEENQLIEVKDKTGVSLAKFTYDHEGKRTSISTSSETIYFHYNGHKVISETNANNAIVAEYTLDANGNPVTMTKGGKTYYYHVNGHGDVTALTDGNGAVVAEYQYDAWGNIISQTGTMASANPYRYAGYRYDEATKLYYLMARYYDSEDGRFITRDTFHGFEEESQSLNLYTYTKNNPVIYVDPDGHNPVLVYFIGAAVARAAIQYIGKKAILKIGSRTFKAVSGNAAKKATVNFANATINVGSKKVYFTKAKMQHIIKNHHPSYWTGSKGKSMFDPSLRVSDIKNIVMTVIRKNKTTINSSLKKGKGVNVRWTVNGIKYEVRISSEGYVSSAYPV